MVTDPVNGLTVNSSILIADSFLVWPRLIDKMPLEAGHGAIDVDLNPGDGHAGDSQEFRHNIPVPPLGLL